jgi:hypothetical protein
LGSFLLLGFGLIERGGGGGLVFGLGIEIIISVDHYIVVLASSEDVLHSLFAYHLNFPLESL